LSWKLITPNTNTHHTFSFLIKCRVNPYDPVIGGTEPWFCSTDLQKIEIGFPAPPASKMDSTDIPEMFFERAKEWICENLKDNLQMDQEKLQEDLLMEGFNMNEAFTSPKECLHFVNNPLDMFEVMSFVANQDKEMGVEPKTEMVDIFNRCWYYTGRMLIYDEWDNMVDEVIQNHPDSIVQETHV
jgi:hypothetical protein